MAHPFQRLLIPKTSDTTTTVAVLDPLSHSVRTSAMGGKRDIGFNPERFFWWHVRGPPVTYASLSLACTTHPGEAERLLPF